MCTNCNNHNYNNCPDCPDTTTVGDTVVFTSFAISGSQICITLTINGLPIFKCQNLPSTATGTQTLSKTGTNLLISGGNSLDLTSIVKNAETVTSVSNSLNSFGYTNEAGSTVNITKIGSIVTSIDSSRNLIVTVNGVAAASLDLTPTRMIQKTLDSGESITLPGASIARAILFEGTAADSFEMGTVNGTPDLLTGGYLDVNGQAKDNNIYYYGVDTDLYVFGQTNPITVTILI